MYVEYDGLGLVERPTMTLCNPNQAQLCSLGNSFDTKLSLKYNALSEFSFTLMQKITDNQSNIITDPAYAFLKSKRLILIENVGYYQIADVEENRESDIPIKNVHATSWESELISKQVTAFTGTSIKFYDPIDNTSTFLGRILEGTNWEIGDIDPDLWDLYRDFDVSSSNIYNVLMTTAETAYNCIFTFDPFERLVSAVSVDNATTNSDIFLSYRNLIKTTSLKEISEEIVTSMDVYGGDGLDIRSVNPLGTNKIYNFSYYQSVNSDDGSLLWISEGLNIAINNWLAKISSNQANYASLLTSLKTKNIALGVYQSDLSILQADLAALIEVQKVKVEQGLDLTDINAQITAKNAQITSKNSQITSITTQITNVKSQIVTINNSLSLTNVANFTLSQQLELKPLIIENMYQNENLIVTESMTPAQVQDQSQQLYNQAVNVLGRASYPRYEFSVSTVNFTALKEYLPFTSQLELGSLVTIENEEGIYISTAVLEINLSFDHLDDFSLVFSNRLRLDNGSYIFSDLYGQVNKSSTTVNFNSGSWDGYSTNKNDILTLNSILNTANNQLINNSGQEIVIDEHGIRGRKLLGDGTFSGAQFWITNNILSFSNDGFLTSKLALGQITLPNNAGTAYGLACEALIGNLIAGNNLIISNSNNTFRVDSSGATLTDATFTITSSAARPNSIILSPTLGILIKNKVGTTVFSVDGNGNITLKGALNGATGSFSGALTALSGYLGNSTDGLTISADGLSDNNGNYLRKNSMHWGALTVNPDGSSVFSGSITASKISGVIVNSQIGNGAINDRTIGSINADKIVAGRIQSIDIYGSTISYGGTIDAPQVSMFGINDVGTFRATSGLQIYVEHDNINHVIDSAMFMSNSNIALYLPKDNYSSSNVIGIGLGDNTIQLSGGLNLLGIQFIRVATPSGNTLGLNGAFPVNTPTGVKTLYISNGIVYRFL